MEPHKDSLNPDVVCPNAQCAMGLLDDEKYYPGHWTWRRGGMNKVLAIRKSWRKGWPYDR